jgi:hypothetical protein
MALLQKVDPRSEFARPIMERVRGRRARLAEPRMALRTSWAFGPFPAWRLPFLMRLCFFLDRVRRSLGWPCFFHSYQWVAVSFYMSIVCLIHDGSYTRLLAVVDRIPDHCVVCHSGSRGVGGGGAVGCSRPSGVALLLCRLFLSLCVRFLVIHLSAAPLCRHRCFKHTVCLVAECLTSPHKNLVRIGCRPVRVILCCWHCLSWCL